MTKELQNLLSLLESPNKENRDLGAIVAQNYKQEFKTHFGYEITELQELTIFLTTYNGWHSQLPLSEITDVSFLSVNLSKFSSSFFLLKKLEYLTLFHNKLHTLPLEIVQCINLKAISIAGNQLQYLPKEIRQLQNLQMLSLGNNQFQYLPLETIYLPNLYYLDLECNQIKFLPKQIGQLQKLEWLKLQSNQLQDLPKEIGQLQQLKQLDLSFNNFQSLPKELAQIKTLQKIYVEGNPTNIFIPDELKHLVDFGFGLKD